MSSPLSVHLKQVDAVAGWGMKLLVASIYAVVQHLSIFALMVG